MASIEIDADRDPEIVELAKQFGTAHLPPHLAAVSEPTGQLAQQWLDTLPDSWGLKMSLTHLLWAKDAAVRAAVANGQA